MKFHSKVERILRTYDRFEDVEKEIRDYVPPTVYKYRTWSDDHHKNLLCNKTVWFSHPFGLNDPFDVRPEAIFDIMELQDERFFEKLLRTAKEEHPHITDETELRRAAEKQRLFLTPPSGLSLQT